MGILRNIPDLTERLVTFREVSASGRTFRVGVHLAAF
jgi:hypothetical protein